MTVGMSTVLLSILILTVANFAVVNDGPSLFKFAYAQTPDPGSSPDDPLAGDNSTNSGVPSDNFTDPGMPSDNSTDLGLTPSDPSADLGMPTDNTTSSVGDNTASSSASNLASNAAVPEFGPLASIVLVISVLSILVFSVKTKLKF
ncbi:MAG TPA: PEFG-CTERM sorting domain-containing protein [Candidatus Nitrosotalea sp.]|nr:PEFG-CTERM sorting domain-containing protein [Candidatus Nitrosotalea sp.]